MIFCQKCGAKIDAQVKFCPSCGTKVGKDTENALYSEERMETLSNIERPSVKSKRDDVKTFLLNTKKPKRRKRHALKLFMSGILATVVLAMLYIFFLQRSDDIETEVNEITFAQAAGYWISHEGSQDNPAEEGFSADQLNLSLYLDEDYVVIASNGEENVEVYTVIDYDESEDNSSLDLLVKDAEDNNRTLSLLSPTEDTDSFTLKLDDEETVEILSVAEEDDGGNFSF